MKWFDAKKGYGFIVHPEGGADIFVHYSAIDTEKRFKTLRTGQVVDFSLVDGPKGLHANDVVPTDDVEQPGVSYMPSESTNSSVVHERSDRAFGGDVSSGGSIRATV